jgi:hypothetical protein
MGLQQGLLYLFTVLKIVRIFTYGISENHSPIMGEGRKCCKELNLSEESNIDRPLETEQVLAINTLAPELFS